MIRNQLVIFSAALLLIGCGKSSDDPQELAITNPSGNPASDIPPQDEPVVSARDTAVASLTPPTAPEPPPVPPTPFERLCEAYKSGDGDGWAKAETDLLAMGADATPSLVAALSTGAAHERELAASLLAQIGTITTEARAALKKALTDELPFVQANAAATLCAIQDQSPEVVETLSRLLKQDDKDGRLMAVSSAGNLGEAAAKLVPEITALLKADEAEIRRVAAETLGRVGQPSTSAVAELQVLADSDPDEATRKAAAGAVALINGEEPKAAGLVIPASSSKPVDQ